MIRNISCRRLATMKPVIKRFYNQLSISSSLCIIYYFNKQLSLRFVISKIILIRKIRIHDHTNIRRINNYRNMVTTINKHKLVRFKAVNKNIPLIAYRPNEINNIHIYK